MNMTEPTQFNAAGLRGKLRHDVEMYRYTSWRTGGRAQHVYQPADLADMVVFLRMLQVSEPLVAVGLGSNLLIRDGGLTGTALLLHAALNELRIESDGTIYCQAGVPGAKLARFAAQHNLMGAEFFAGIPGTLGGMLAMNAGCYGGETWNVTERVQVVTRSGELRKRAVTDYDIGYRHAVLKDKQRDVEIYAGAWLRLPAGDGEIARSEIRALLTRRIASQPLQIPNAGSVFRNPPGGHAARLIEQCGLKGLQIGGAQVSEQHANFILNVNKASATDIENLIKEVQLQVVRQTGVILQCEVRVIGEKA